MRVRITRRRHGEVDGVDLFAFEVGLTYDLSPSLATYLVLTGTADPVVDERPSSTVPVEVPQPAARTRAAAARPERAIAADTSRPIDDPTKK